MKKFSSGSASLEIDFSVVLTIAAFAYFLLRLFYFATHISSYVPPDEVTRFGICQVFSKTLLLPENSEETYSLGLVTHIPYLYYFIMGKLLKLNVLPVSDLVFLRLINCALSFATVIYGYKWMRLITSNRLCHLFFVILITNTPMFSFLGASVSYDNLTNLFAVMALYYLHLFLRSPSPKGFILFTIFLLGGSLTKTAFLPLLLALVGLLIFRERRQLKTIFPTFQKTLSTLRVTEKVLLGIALLLLILNMNLYLENLIRFQKIVPSANQILTEEQCMQYRIYARERIVSLYNGGLLTFDEAVEKAKEIQHPGDRAGTLSLLEIARANKIKPIPLMDRIQYAWLWMEGMLHRTVGILGHLSLIKHSYLFSIYQLIFLLSFVFFVRYWNPNEASGRLTDALFLCLFYTLTLMQFVNYPIYTRSLSTGLALQGRYFFPVLVPFYGIVTYYLISPFKKSVQITILLLISVFFIWGDFPYFLQNATSHWFFPNTQ